MEILLKFLTLIFAVGFEFLIGLGIYQFHNNIIGQIIFTAYIIITIILDWILAIGLDEGDF